MLDLTSLLGMSTLNIRHQEISHSKALFSLIAMRLSLMHQVTLYKYQHQLPIYVPEFEQKILEKVKIEAINFGLPVAQTQESIQVQMRIAVAIQQQWHQYWKEKGLPLEELNLDLDNVLRPEMSRLMVEIIKHIAKAKKELSNPNIRSLLSGLIAEIVDVPFVTDLQRETLLNSLIDIAQVRS